MNCCAKCGANFTVSSRERAALQKTAPGIRGQTYEFPEPALCPPCREQLRLSHRNERFLYRRKCDLSGENIIAAYHPDAPLTVYRQDLWWGDDWDPWSFGRPFDFSRPFFEQFQELRRQVPWASLLQHQNENSAYTNCVSNLKDCYLLFSSDYCRSCAYGVWIEKSRDSLDNFLLMEGELTAGSIWSDTLYNCRYLVSSSQCRDSAFLFDCRSCSNCFLSAGLRHKEYYFENQPCSKEEYERKLAAYDLGSAACIAELKKQLQALIVQTPKLFLRRRGRIVDSSGDFLADVEGCTNCYELISAKDCEWVTGGFELKDTLHANYVSGEAGYENCECFPQPFHSAFNLNSYTGHDLYYCDGCMGACSNLFGCAGLKHGEYGVLNQRYSRDEYEALIPRIIAHMRETGEWGKFFSPELSLYGYNETNAFERYPLTREQAVRLGYSWREEDVRDFVPATAELPDRLADAGDDVVRQTYACSRCKKNYRFAAFDLSFHRKTGLALPRECPECRQRERGSFRRAHMLRQASCVDCSTEILTAYEVTDGPVLCEACYLRKL